MTRRWPFPRLAFARRSARDAARMDDGADAQFRRLILPHLDAAWTYARYLTRDDHVAEDIVQDAFLRAFRGSASCKGDGKAWLMTIVRNCWHDWLRANRSEVPAVSDAGLVDADTPDVVLERSSDAAHLRLVLAMLPEPFRETLVLRELEELSYREIGAVTGVPIGTVMSRLARGREMLATLILDSETGTDRQGVSR